jgi:hypothetical protein
MNDMSFTFGIITNAQNGVNEFLPQAVQSIIDLNIPKYEIIIVGSKNEIIKHELLQENSKLKIINFDESVKAGWITKKKNIITQIAKYENVSYQHDYIVFDQDWYNGFKKYGENFKACMVKIKNKDGTRFRDHLLFPWHHCTSGKLAQKAKRLWEYSGIENNNTMLPYDELRLSKYQYFSGSYWIAKKSIMNDLGGLNENLCHEQGEDVEFSERFNVKYNYSMNPFSTVKFLKQKQDAFGLMKPECLEKCIQFIENNDK